MNKKSKKKGKKLHISFKYLSRTFMTGLGTTDPETLPFIQFADPIITSGYRSQESNPRPQ